MAEEVRLWRLDGDEKPVELASSGLDLESHPRRGVRADKIALGSPYIALEHMPRRCIALSG